MNEWLDVVLQAISEKKGEDIFCYDVSSVSPFLDTMIVASTANNRQSNAIAQNIKDRLKEAGYEGDIKVEGDSNSRWLLIDLKDIVVNLFVNEERDVYALDKLYSDVPMKIYDL